MHIGVKRALYIVAKTIATPLGLYPFPKTHRRHLLDILHGLQINCVLDVGAHYGEFGQLLRGIGFKGTIVSFEPVSASFQRLQRSVAGDNSWHTFPFALGAEDTAATIHLYEASDFNSFLPADPNVHDRFEHCTREVGEEIVPVRRLDAVFPDLNLDLSTLAIYLKMDTQGYDKNVVQGSVGVLGYICAIQSELPAIKHYMDQPDMLETLAYCHSLGYAPTGFFPVNHERDGITVMEWDCVLARSCWH